MKFRDFRFLTPAVLSRIVFALSLLALGAGAVARDGDRDRDRDEERAERGDPDGGRGRGRDRDEFRRHGKNYEYRFRDERCDYHYQYNAASGRTFVKEKGDCRHVAAPFEVVEHSPVPRVIAPVPVGTIGRCDHERVGQVLGGIAGGAIGSQVGTRDNRAITTAGGVLIGILIGGAIGQGMDEADHACVSQALEFAQAQQAVSWKSGAADYVMTPGPPAMSGAIVCRPYVVRIVIGGREQLERGRACRQADGTWLKDR